MRDHSFDQRLCEVAHPRWGWAKFPKIIDLVRPFAALKIAPEMILNRSFSSAPSFTHSPSAVWKPSLLVYCEDRLERSKFPPLHARLRCRDSFCFQDNARALDSHYQS